MNEPLDGLLIIDKPAGRTSFSVVAQVRRLLGLRKAGHAGTLDPQATGILVVGTGRATRILRFVEGVDKVYCGTLRLGAATDTDDADGQILATAPVPELSPDALFALLEPFRGTISQVPPRFSAVKIQGVRAYRRARRQEEFTLKSREVRIHSLDLLSYDSATGDLSLRVRCSKGTYIRSLARDIGARAGCGGHLRTLRRESIGPFALDRAVPINDATERETLVRALLPLATALSGIATVAGSGECP